VTSAVLIGASAGGIDPLLRLAEQLPADIDAPVLVVVHIPADADSRLPEILQRRCALAVAHARDGDPLRPGRVYIAPPDQHLTLEDGVVRVMRGPRQNRHRPAIDSLFRSGARWAGDEAIAVILSGAAGDGVTGAVMVARRGGRVFVQDPAEALFPGMPSSVLDAVPDAVRLPVDDISAAIGVAVGTRRQAVGASTALTGSRSEIRPMDEGSAAPPIDPGRPSYSCPDCGGVLEEVVDRGPLRFRCRVGHEFYAEDLSSAQWSTLEDALWSAVRGMEESAELAERLARMAHDRGATSTATRHRERAADVREEAEVIRAFLLRPVAPADETDEDRGATAASVAAG
jgi:two-component system chemotaxis response regulator CheB